MPIGVGPPLIAGARKRFVWRFVSKVYWLPVCANHAAPTRAEIGSGLDLASFLVGVAGFHVEQQRIEIPDVMTQSTIQRRGSVKFAASAINFYDDLTNPAVRATFTPGTSGFVALLPYGDVAGRRCEIWPVDLMVAMDLDWTNDAKAATFAIPVAVTSMPELGAVVPA